MSDESKEAEAPEMADAIIKGVTLTPFLTALFKPTADYLGIELRDLVREPIERWKLKRKERNLRAHLDQVRSRVQERLPELPPPEIKTTRQADFFSEWAESVEDVDPNDKELSQIWQDLMARVACGEDISAELMRALKTLTPGEAQFLLRLRRIGPWLELPFPFPFPQMLSRRDLFYARALEQKQLVERSYLFSIVSVVSVIFTAGCYIYLSQRHYYKSIPLTSDIDRIATLGMALIIVAAIVFVAARQFVQWRLSWLGRELTRITERKPKREPNGA